MRPRLNLLQKFKTSADSLFPRSGEIWYVACSLDAFPIAYPWHGQSGAGRAAARPARLLLAFRKPGEGLVLIVRPLVLLADIAIRHNALIPGATCLIRWQSHWHVVRQSWPFFQNDFAGRIANRVMQTANALRESAMASIRAVWYIGAYGATAWGLMAMADWRLGVPTLVWFA